MKKFEITIPDDYDFEELKAYIIDHLYHCGQGEQDEELSDEEVIKCLFSIEYLLEDKMIDIKDNIIIKKLE